MLCVEEEALIIGRPRFFPKSALHFSHCDVTSSLRANLIPVTGRQTSRSLRSSPLTWHGCGKTPAVWTELRPRSNEPKLDPISGDWINSPARPTPYKPMCPSQREENGMKQDRRKGGERGRPH